MSDDFGLNEQQKKFVEEYIKLGNATQAAKNAGYSEISASKTASDMVRKNKKVMEAIEAARAKLVEPKDPNKFDREQAIKEADEAYAVAKIEGNAQGMVRASEYKAELMGYKKASAGVGFSVKIVGLKDESDPELDQVEQKTESEATIGPE